MACSSTATDAQIQTASEALTEVYAQIASRALDALHKEAVAAIKTKLGEQYTVSNKQQEVDAAI
ncbi:hypothetical protein BG004_003868, partial [Podila humilis]